MTKVNAAEIFVLRKEENIMGKGDNAGDQHFLSFSTMFSTGFHLKDFTIRDCLVKG